MKNNIKGKAKLGLFILVSLFSYLGSFAQMTKDESKWTFEAKKKPNSKNLYELIIHVSLPNTWHIYSLKPGGDGMEIPPSFTFEKNEHVSLKGDIKEKGKLISEKLEGIDGIVNMFKDKVDYTQLAEITEPTTVKGTYGYQICNDQMCLPPVTKNFEIVIKEGTKKEEGKTEDKKTEIPNSVNSATIDTLKKIDTVAKNNLPAADTSGNKIAASGSKLKGETKNDIEKQSLLMLFFIALGGGLVSVLTPCIFSMIPITVSFFTKRSKNHSEAVKNALYYSASIIIIFTVLGVLISATLGATALNSLSTNWIANLFFFGVFLLFGISFLGAFEITLPASWTNVTDKKAGLGSFFGIFFMALTLVIVSFSCTGPIVGPLLVLAGKGGIMGPIIGMFGFSIGMALPFALFAIFPGLVNKISHAGGWQNQVKVVLGFIELMLALKFLSNADLAQGWRLLDREIFIAIWIVLSILLGFYLLDKFKLSHDDASSKNLYGQEYVSIFKLLLSITCFVFAVYLLPGMWGAPLNGVSAFVPPMGTFDAFGAPANTANENPSGLHPVKYASDMKIYEPPVVRNLGLVTFFDYEEALAASKKYNKPVMLDFTGINCVNCRKMESQVWSKPEVAKALKEDFIVVSLYCDINRIVLPKNEQYFSKDLNQQVVTLGNKNSDLQAAKYGSNSQPFYFFVDENGTKLAEDGYPYDPDIQKFLAHLDKVKKNFKKLHP